MGKNLRMFGGITLALGGALLAVVAGIQTSLIAGGAAAVNTLVAAYAFTGWVNGLGSILLVIGFVALALSRGAAGVRGSSLGVFVGFILLAVVMAIATIWFRLAPYVLAPLSIAVPTGISLVLNVLVILATLLTAVFIVSGGAVRGLSRWSLFVPGIVLLVLQFPSSLPATASVAVSLLYPLSWVFVGISYLAAQPRAASVPATSENLAE